MKSLLKKLTAILLVLNIVLPYLNIGLIKSYAVTAQITNAKVYFLDNGGNQITSADPLQKVQLNLQIGMASDEATEPRDVEIQISDANFYFEEFLLDAGTGKYLYSVELYSGGPTITMELVHNNDGSQKIIVKSLEQGQTLNLNLGGYFTNNALPGESVTATIEEGNSVTLNVTNVPSGVTATNTKTVSKNSISFTEGNTAEMAAQFPITYTIGASVDIASQYQSTDTLDKLTVTDTMLFPDGMYINSSANIADYISVGNTSAFSSSDFSPIYSSSDNSKIIGFSLNKDLTGSNITDYLSNGATISLSYGSDMNITQDGNLSNTITTGYETTHFSGSASPVTVNTSIDVRQGPKFEENNKWVSDYSGSYISIWNGGDSSGYFIQDDTVTFTLSAKNTGDETGNVTINDLIPAGTSVVSTSPSGTSSTQTINGQSENVMSWTFNNVAAGDTVTATITLKIDNNDNYTIQNKMYLNNDYSSEVASSKELTVKSKRAEITPTKTYSSTGGDFTNPGDTVTYTITVSNTGSAATTIPIYDEFPSELTFVSCTGGGTYTAAHQEQNGDQTVNVPAKVDWGNVYLDVGQTVTYQVVATVNDGVTGWINNKVKADDKEASVSTKPFDENIIDNLNINKTTATTYAEKDEVVDYTIYVGNQTGFNIRLSDLTDGKLVIQDILPNFLTYEGGAYYLLPDDATEHTSGISYSNNVIYFEISSSDLATFEKNKVIEIHVPSKVVSDPPEGGDRDITNIAKVGESTATATIKQKGSSGISIEKYIAEIKDNNNNTIYTTQLNSNTEEIDVSVASNYYITYSTRIYNSSSNAITLDADNGYFEDNPMYGLFAEDETYFVIDPNDKNNVNVVVTDSSGNQITTLTAQLGYYYDYYNQNTYNMQFDLSGTTIPANDYITITYTYKTHSSNVADDVNQFDFVRANNTIRTKADSSTSQEVKNKELLPSMSKQVAAVDKSSLPLDENNYINGNDNTTFFNTINGTLINSLNFADNQKYSLSEIKDKYFIYKVSLDMKGDVDYTYDLTDTISSNLEFVPNNAASCGTLAGPVIAIYRKASWTWNDTEGYLTYNSYVVNPADILVSGNTLSMKLKVNESNPVKYYVEVYYLVRLKDGVYDQLESQFENSEISIAELLNNANIRTEELDENNNPIYEESDDAPIYVKEGQIHPGLEKEYLGSFADGVDEFDWNGNPVVTIGASNPGAHLVWRMAITNPVDDYATTMKNYTVVEQLPSPYVFDNNYQDASYTGATYKPIIAKFDSNGNMTKVWMGDDATNPFVMPTFSGDDNRTLTWTFNGDTWALEPGESLHIVIPTKVTGAGVSGTFLNTAQVITEQDFEKKDVSNGTYIDENTIEDTDFANISLYVTSSYKEIEYDPALAPDADYEQPAQDTAAGKKVNDVLDNTVQGHQGEKVKYTLNIKNESPARLSDLIVIDRFPYVGDIGVIADYERKSSFEVKWDSFISAKVYDSDGNYSRTIDPSKIRITFSDEKEEVFPYGVGEWDGNDSGATNVTNWSSTPTDNTVNVRFEFEDDTSTYLASQETIKIEFYGLVPAYVDTNGEENVAWNNFAYGYMPVNNEGIELSSYNIAEPAKVGVWVEELEKIDIPVKKTWSDYNNADNTRPESVNIKLLANNVVVDQHTVTATDNWEYTFENKPVRDNNNQLITYTIEEDAVQNYTSTVTGFTINNEYVATTSVSGTKTWNDKNNNDDTRPSSITINLYANGSFVTSKNVTADINGDWTYEFTGLDKYDENNQLINYSITEDTVYTKDGTETYTSEINGTNITNTYVPKTSVSGTKTWNDYNNIENTRPSSIVVNLVKDNEIIGSKAVSPDINGNWTYEFTNLDKYDENNQLIQYRVTENAVENYSTSIDGYNITNTYTTSVSVSGTKIWNDYNNKEGTRPNTIKINLLRNSVKIDEQTVSANSNWTFEFTGLDKYYNDNGTYRLYNYSITEDTVQTADGTDTYETEIVPGVDGYTFAVTNTYEIKTSYNVRKVWDDNDDQDGVRPNSVTVQLYANNVAVGETITLSAGVDETWQEGELSYQWNNLDKYDSNNNLIIYTVQETTIPDDYSVSYDSTTESDTTIVKNTKTPDETQYTVKKIWNDSNNQDGKRPTSIQVQLKANNENYGDAITLSTGADGNWDAADLTYTWTALPKNSNGTPIVYSVEETAVGNGYTTSYDTSSEAKTTIITNSRTPEETTYTVKKIWNDNNNQDGKRPTSIQVQLKANNVTSGNPITLSTGTDGNWDASDLTYSWTGLPKYDNGTVITYSVEETALENDYTATYDTSVAGETTITNSRTPEETTYTVKKVWDDSNNQDGKRPTSITVQLKADNENYREAVTLSTGTDSNWDASDLTYTWTGLPKYNNGNIITYSVEETAVENGYTTTYDTSVAGETTITNSRTPEETTYTVKKVWDDANNQDGKRPTSITVQLKADNENYRDAVTLSTGTDGNWDASDLTYTWTALPKYKNGNVITYSVEETAVGNDYTTTYDTTSEDKTTIVTNSRTPEETTYTVKKVWDDANNQDGKRPTTIEVQLKADNENYREAVTLSTGTDGNWDAADLTYTWTALPKYKDGNVIAYSVEETAAGNGYTTSYDTSVAGETTITNSRTPEETTYTVKKQWNDNNNQDGKRPTTIEVQLKADNENYGAAITLSTGIDGVWDDEDLVYEWTGLPKYNNGDVITYSVEETAVGNDYTTTYDTTSEDKTTIVTNSRTPEETTYTVNKIWDDSNNQDGKRPTTITVQLKGNGYDVRDAVTLSTGTDGNWDASDLTYTWEHLQKNSNGTPIVYTVEETAINSGYTTTYDTSVSGVTTITNSYTPGEVNYSVEKIWDDSHNQDGKRPTSIEVELQVNNQAVTYTGITARQTLDSSNSWSYTWQHLPEKQNGQTLDYKVVEISNVSDYEEPTYEYTTGKTTITNTHNPEETTYTVKKIWDDSNNQDGKRPTTIEVQLKADNVAKGDKITLTAGVDNTWDASDLTYTWTGLPKYNNGNIITYSVEETAVENGYTITYDTSVAGETTITNSRTPEETTYTVKKVWDDSNNQDGKRPTTIEVQLKADNVAKGDKITLTTGVDNTWDASDLTYTWTGLPKYNNGNVIAYSVEETAVGNSYTTTYDTSVAGETTITNSRTPEETTYTVKKIWDDSNNQDGKRPTSITVQLKADNENYRDAVTLSTGTDSNWDAADLTYTWNNLPKYKDGNVITYSVEETAVGNGYTTSYDTSVVGETTITNSRTPEETTYTVKKVWDDANNQDGKRPTSITVQLKADNENYGDAITLTTGTDDNWDVADLTYTWTALPKYKNGNVIAYSVEETAVGNGYTTSYDTSVAGETTITNSRTPEETTYTVKKQWNDNNNQDGKRPTSITVQLKADNENYREAVTLSTGTDGNWDAADLMYTWNNLPKYKNGNVITYSVEETAVGNDYVATYDTVSEDKTTIIVNTRTIEKTTYNVEKVWNDSNNQDNKRPTSIQVQLKKNGTALGNAITLNAGNEWKYEWTDLDKNENGLKINYSAEEVGNIEEYTTSSNVTDEKTTITNSRDTDQTTYYVKKVWNDSNNQDGIRSTSISVQLKANKKVNGLYTDVNVGEAQTLNSANNWEYTWTGLDKNSEGSVINYSIVELGEITGYTTSYDTSVSGQTTIANSHTPEETTYTVKKIWDDKDNQDGKRPTTIEVQLKANNTAYGNPITLSTGTDGNWDEADLTYTWTGLPKNENGVAIVYSVEEAVTGNGYSTTYDTSVSGETTIKNSYTPGEVTYSVEKVWNDSNNQDNKRPTSIEVELQVNGETFVYGGITARQTLNSENSWKYTWEHLPEKLNGTTVTYTVAEITSLADYNEPTYSHTSSKTTITNSRTTDKTTYNVEKVWNDNNNQDGIRSSSINVQLRARKKVNGEYVEVNEGSIQTLNANNSWKYEWANLEKNSEGEAIEYSVAELSAISGYTTSYNTETEGKTIITNSHTPEETTYSVEKVWDDANNQDGKRPTSIVVQLMADGNKYGDTVTLTTGTDGIWDESDLTHTWTGLPKNSDGNEIIYSVEEQTVGNGYSVTYDNETYTSKTIIKNSYTPGVVSYNVKKVWDDANDQDGKRPNAVLVELVAKVDGTEITLENVVKRQILNSNNQWQYTWINLPQMSGGKTISYSAIEVSNYSDYNTPAYEYGNGITTVTNTHIPEKTTRAVEKIWDDNNNQDGIRPESIKVQLKANGNAYGSEITLNSTNNWKYTWTDLDVYANGSAITYTIVETSTVTGYTSSSSVDGNKTEITNKHTPEETIYSVEKVWDDKNNQDGVRPVSVKVQLYANGIAYGDPVFLEAGFDNVWQSDELSYTWRNLPKYANGNEITYTAEELDSNSNYTVTTVRSSGKTIITNRHIPEETSYTVEKVWIDNDNQDGIRPTKVNVKLKADGVTIKEAILSEANHWKVTWNNLDKYSNGELITYSIEEINVSDGYTDTYDTSVDGIVVIQNKHIPEETSYKVEKIWSDYGNVDKIRPDFIKVQLYADGEKYGAEKTLHVGVGNKWTEESSQYTWNNLPKYKAEGQLIEYTVEEVEVPSGYSVVYLYDEGITSINNIHIPVHPRPHDPIVVITGKKTWEDNNDEYGIRPNGVTIRLLKDGELAMTYFATADTNWTYEFTDLPKFDENGREIVYTISENPVEGYTTKIDGTNIINTIIPKIEEPEEEKPPVSIKTGDKIIINITEFIISTLIIVGYTIGKKKKDNK